MMKTIQDIIKNHTCTGCGVCSQICPNKCIKTVLDYSKGYYTTTFDSTNCIKCGLCTKVCPILSWKNNDGNLFVGKSLKVYSGYCTDNEHRFNAASGGITTSILSYLLEIGEIDAAVVSFRKNLTPLESELKIVATREDILNSKGSVYSPTSYNSDILSQIKASTFTKFAIVGLPCHIEALSRLCEIDKNVSKKIKYKIALLCGHTPSLLAYNYSFKQLHINLQSVKTIKNRGEGWPGYMKIYMTDGQTRRVKYGSKYSWGQTLGSSYFTPDGCKHCVDVSGYNADISICDAWLSDYKKDNIGVNLVLVRNPDILLNLYKMAGLRILKLKEETVERFIIANENVFKEKLCVNHLRNRALQKKCNFYSDFKFIPLNGVMVYFFTNIYIVLDNIISRVKFEHINDFLLYCLKVSKFLSLKWMHIRKY